MIEAVGFACAFVLGAVVGLGVGVPVILRFLGR